ncbi:class I SAM-dependent methyltransferase [Aliikangiella coralliicola]|uniref:class I SAM-dependent methyltransferase n=1 Tax=Aliikangiella coralliicola TaxID=2592383 RepID=UPI00143DA95F|nr:methyltransferase domain-containing protein [Aliikangiella coralliicola]
MSLKNEELGSNRHQLIAEKLAPHLAQIFGYHALLYSPLAKSLCGEELVIKHQVIVAESGAKSPKVQKEKVTLQCLYTELPIAADTIDLAVLPNVLQNSTHPHQVLREVERILIPEGVAIIVGRNPFSWQGVNFRFQQWRQKPKTPIRDISRSRIADWFSLLGFEAEAQINISLTNDKLQNSHFYSWVKKLGYYVCEFFCSYYVIIARKKVSTLTPIRPSWRRNKQLVPPRLAEPSVKSQVENWFNHLKNS